MPSYDAVNSPIDLEIIRGDTLKLVFKLSKKLDNGTIVPMDTSNLYVYFTVKPDYITEDEDAVIKVDYPVHSLIVDAEKGIMVLSVDTANLESRTYVYDVQFVRFCETGTAIDVQTPIRGKLSVIPDVTRRTSRK
jgi:hypothetical protein